MVKGRGRRDRTEVSCVIKYFVFAFNVIFWLIGAAIFGIGIWAWSEKQMFDNIKKLGDIPVDPALGLIIMGFLVFIIGFTGCVGALRENTCLLLIYLILVSIILLLELAVGVLFFVFKDWLKDQINDQLKSIIIDYREDPDLQNLIDWVQEDWLKCCGVEGPDDWDANIYFNCSSPSRERCGVPFSCCKVDPDQAIVNRQCGYDTRDKDLTPSNEDKIYTEGCLKAGEDWLNSNIIPVAGVVVGIALAQILGICFAQNLRSDIFAQRMKWEQ